MTWIYRRHGVTEEFGTKGELADYLQRMDSCTAQDIRYWYVENNFDLEILARDLTDGLYRDVSPDDWLDDALDEIEDRFSGDEWYDWETDDICGIVYREEDE